MTDGCKFKSRLRRLKRMKSSVEKKRLDESKKMKLDESVLRAVSQEDLTNAGLSGKIRSSLDVKSTPVIPNSLEDEFEKAVDDDEDDLLSDRRVKSQPSSPNKLLDRIRFKIAKKEKEKITLTPGRVIRLTSTDSSQQRIIQKPIRKCTNNVVELSTKKDTENKKEIGGKTSPSWVQKASDWTFDSTEVPPLVYQNHFDDGQSTSCPNLMSSRTWLFGKNAELPLYDLNQLKELKSNVKFIDTHCHLDFLFKRIDFKNSYTEFRRLNESDFPSCYEGCIANFCDPTTFDKSCVWEGILNEENVWGAFGCHPHFASKFTEKTESQLKNLMMLSKSVALGEIGLDYSLRNRIDHKIQQKVFRQQLKIAVEMNKPLVIHSRDAAQETLNILKEIIPRDHKIHRHCFTSDWTEAQIWLKEFPNLFLGITPVVTFPTATEVHEVAKRIPIKRLLLETDAPYFVPRSENKCTKWSNPGMAIHVAAQIAALRFDVTLEDVLKITRENTKKMYSV